MVDFTKALQLGLDASGEFRAKKIEVQSVLSALEEQINTVLEHPIFISQETLTKSIEPKNPFFAAVAFAQEKVSYEAIVARAQDVDVGFIELAKFETDKSNVYPCRISFVDIEIACYNKDELESGLFDLLSNARTGEKFERLLLKINNSKSSE